MSTFILFWGLLASLTANIARPCAHLLLPDSETVPPRFHFSVREGVLSIHDRQWNDLAVMEVRFLERKFYYAGTTSHTEPVFARRAELHFRMRAENPELRNTLINEAGAYLLGAIDGPKPYRLLHGNFFASADFKYLMFPGHGGFQIVSRETGKAVEWIPVDLPHGMPQLKWTGKELILRLISDHLKAFYGQDP
jgi:hypothetical protein